MPSVQSKSLFDSQSHFNGSSQAMRVRQFEWLRPEYRNQFSIKF